MRIRSVTPYWVSLPLTTPIKMSNVTVSTTENLLVRVEDTDGFVGWGEACSAPTMTGDLPEGLVAGARFMGEQVAGTEVEDPAAFFGVVDAMMYGNQGAKSAIEIAIWDIAGKRAGVPVAELLGGVVRKEVANLWMVASGDKAKDVASAKRLLDEGFVAFKVKVGGKNPEADLERAAAVREAIGKGARISADANQGYSRENALKFAEGAEAAGLDFLEQLVDGHDLATMADIVRATKVPLGADEGIHSLEDIEKHHRLHAAHGASLKTIKLGGLTPVMQAARRMDQLGMHINLAGKVADSSVASAAIMQLAAAVPQLDWDVSMTCVYLVDDVTIETMRPIRGHGHLPERPGLGIEVDEAKLTRSFAKLAA